jgi:hypothetical protein
MDDLTKNFKIETITGSKLLMRKMKLSEIDKILSSKTNTFLENMIDLLNSCTIKVIEKGIYNHEIWDWKNTYEGDWFDALLKLRGNTYKSKYEFEVRCQNPMCKAKNHIEIDLSNMPVFEPNEKILEIIKENKTKIMLETDLGNLTFRLPTANQSIALENSKRLSYHKKKKMKKNRNDITMERIGNTVIVVNDLLPKQVEEWKRELEADEGVYLLDLIDEYSFGIDTEIDTQCDNCDADITMDMPFTKDFFLPTRKRRSSR